MSYRIRTAAVLAASLLIAGPVLAQPPAAPASPAQAPPDAAAQAQIAALMDPAVEEHLRAVTAAVPGARTVRTLRGRLAPGAVQKFNIVAEAGTFYIAAVCDDACGDIDLRMLTTDGQLAAEDARPSKFPLTQAEVTGRVTFDVEVVMKACSKDPCAWGVRILSKPAQAAAAK